MSRYELRGTLGVGDEPDSCGEAYGPTGLSTDYHWEYGFDCGGLTYYAHIYEDVPDNDLKEHERERPLIWIGEASCSVETVEQLQRQMGIDLRPDVANCSSGRARLAPRRRARRVTRRRAPALAPASGK